MLLWDMLNFAIIKMSLYVEDFFENCYYTTIFLLLNSCFNMTFSLFFLLDDKYLLSFFISSWVYCFCLPL